MRNQTTNNIIKTKLAKMFMDKDGILWLTIDHQNSLTIDDIKDFVAAIIKITGGEKATVIVKSLNYKLPSREVRNYSAGEEASKIIKAVAFLATHPVTRIGANFFLKLNKPPFPFQIFTEEKEAVAWLKNLKT